VGPWRASINRTARAILTTMNVNIVMLASPSTPAESFRIERMTDHAVSVLAGAHVSIESRRILVTGRWARLRRRSSY
jgi:hypothetical protein